MSKTKKHLFLIDGSGFIFRAFHALPPLTRPDGVPIGAVYGFTNMLLKVLGDHNGDDKPDYVAVIFDAARKTFRNEIYKEYKAHRPDVPPELIPQFPLVREATIACNVPAIELANFEADDLIASYAREAVAQGMEVTIVTGDKDMMQLVSDHIELFDPIKSKPITAAEVEEKFGVGPDKVIDVQALAGDSSDNVPGVPGIGVKTAAELIREYGSVENLLKNADKIKQPKRREALINHAEDARISKQLVTLKNDVPLPLSFEAIAAKPIDKAQLVEFLRVQNFKNLLAKWGAGMPVAATTNISPPRDEPQPVGETPKPKAPAKTEYTLIQTEDQLDAWLKPLLSQGQGIIAVDTETDALSSVSANLVGISLAYEAGKACYIPLGHRSADKDLFGGSDKKDLRQMPIAAAIKKLKPILESPDYLKVGQNIKYDMQVLWRYGTKVMPYDDTMVISYVLTGGQHGHGMDGLAERYLGHTTIKFKDVVGTGKNQITFDLVALDKACAYAAEDADITLRLHQSLKPRLVPERATTLYETIERPLAAVLAAVESEGILVDRAVLSNLSQDFATRLAAIEKEIYALAGHEFNIASPKQMGDVLFGEMKIAVGSKTKTGAWSTDAETLEELSAGGHVIADKILEWRQLAKLKSTYTDALQEQINPKTGRVHTSFHMTGTNTGRLSSTDPNLQNIPVRTVEGKKIRTAFVAPPGKLLISADYSQIELRLLAEMANVPGLKKAFHEGIDIHALTASEMFGVPVKDMDSDTRRKAKAINFGIIYGISAFGLAKQVGTSNAEARQFIDMYFSRFPEIRDFMEAQKEFCRKHLYVVTLFGRKCFIPDIGSKNGMQRSFGERQAINAPLQGTAADIIKRAMVKLPDAIAASKLDIKMLLQVHDELVFEAPEKDAEAAGALVQSVMQEAHLPAVKLGVPLNVDVTVAERWS